MSVEPPPFQEAARCDVCKCSFNTFRRRHHCRCCGRTLCHEHSSFQMALPQFGIHSSVRVCADCFNNSSQSKVVGQPPSLAVVDQVGDTVSQLSLDGDLNSEPKPAVEHQPALGIPDCKCGMPLCICETPAQPMETEAVPSQKKTASTSTQYNPKPKKTDSNLRNRGSTSNSKLRNLADESRINYEASGEGLREAIKNGDTIAVKKLLSEGVDANYHDKQGLSLLHVAAVFNQTDIVFALIENGASLDYKNAQGETPLDCAPASLQYKIREKMEGQ
ncbi:vacuolar protein sorting-associated protein 27 [Cucumis melo var. makuwa]|uniref:Vacuolar protein sorting-associated protein 27 n=2 Tax=Cucumis melo TaxID=3656 RepID=A0ABM3KHT5_CUCME|nr:vacuolar protein sorting-associated protein 27 [Cucumis melo]XP_050937351.1 vacuolar protein sorting-associated protein 27 [Cucumis melo]KAA0055738.1 vacuolar protein sorting-associated protein 27 [Cucumis melo var. makuwa]TYK09987.1 vacuolar protein sorting-associated protein 27 [Cucumis melo var. makuwa]